MQDLSLEKIEAVLAAIKAATTVQEIKKIHDMAEAAKVYVQQQKIGKEAELQMSEYIIRAERKLGEVLQKAKADGQFGEGKPFHTHTVEGDDSKVNLNEVGLTRDLSSRAQKIAAVDEKEFEQVISEGKEKGKLTKRMFAKKRNSQESNPKPPKSEAAAIETEPVRNELEPQITPEMLPRTYREKFERIIGQEKARLAAQFHNEVNARVKEFLAATIGPRLQKEQKEARWIMLSRKGAMTRKQ
jgi:hypothetical protein